MATMSIAILCCGGTIDKNYYDAKSDYRIGAPAAEDILRRARVFHIAPPKSVMRKDSLDITAAGRTRIANAARQNRARRIVITHGTDTMAQTARAIVAALAKPPQKTKTIVLTGAFLPAKFRDSDADFNIGFALGAAG
ncbi:MAG: asparaginase domain-containing protein, partial [Gammaproteobacteria bacterium]